MNLNDLRMSLKAALDNMWARIDARITAIEQGGGGGGVTGVKGDAESSYRQGNVNLTPANIGAVDTSDVINVAHGGTGATQGTIDITDYCTFPTGNVNTSSPFGGRLYYNPYLNCVFGTIVMNDGASVINQADIVYLKKDSSGTPLGGNNTRAAACGVCVHSEKMPVVVPRISGSTINSSHISNDAITNPRYTIMAFLG